MFAIIGFENGKWVALNSKPLNIAAARALEKSCSKETDPRLVRWYNLEEALANRNAKEA